MPPVLTQQTARRVVVRSTLLDGVTHAVGTRHGGVSPAPYATLNVGLSTSDSEANVIENRRRLLNVFGTPTRLLTARLSHGRHVSVFKKRDQSEEPATEQGVFHSDGVVSNAPGTTFFMTFADCVPLLFWDPERRVVGLAHAGWRGTALRISEAMIQTMHAEFSCEPADILVSIGPSVGPCCYDVGPEVLENFARNRSRASVGLAGDRTMLDLWDTNRRQLASIGVRHENIELLNTCTSCHVADFFSHRAERGLTGRFGAYIGLESEG
jgi:polyphenol oxidase